MIAWMLLAVAAAEPTGSATDAGPAARPSPVRLCADAASGSEIEVCLRLAASHPEAVDGIAAALRARLDRATSHDRELLLAVLALFDGGTGPEAADGLVALADPRAVPPLVYAAETRSGPLAIAAVQALPAWPESIRPLSGWLFDREVDLELRLAAARALGVLGTAEAGDALVDLLRRPRVPPPLRLEAQATLARHWPDRAAKLERRAVTDGTVWLTAGSAWTLGAAMATAGHFGRAELAELGAATGAAAGGTAAWLFARAWPMEAGDAALVSTSAVLGTAGGALIGAAADDPDVAWWTGLGGTVAGYGLGYGLRRAHPGTAADALEGSGLALVAGLGAGATGRALGADPRLPAGLGVLGGAALGHAVAPAVDLELADAPLLAAATGYGAGLGWALGRGGDGAAAGGAVGALVGYGLAGAVDAPPDVLLGGAAGAGLGVALGVGLGRLGGEAEAPGAIGGAMGLAAGTALAIRDPEPVDDRDVILFSLVTGWTAWQVGGWTLAAGRRLDEPIGGLALAAPAIVGVGTLLWVDDLDVPVTHTAAATSLGLWGGWFGGIAGQLVGDRSLPGALVGSNVGLVGGSVALSPAVGLPPLVVGLADAGGVLGGSVAALGASFATGDRDTIRLASLVGAGAGLATGAIVGTAWRRTGNTRDVALRLPDARPRVTLGPAASGWGARVEVRGW